MQDIEMQMMEMMHLLQVMEMLHLMYQIKARYKSISMFPRDIALDKKSLQNLNKTLNQIVFTSMGRSP